MNFTPRPTTYNGIPMRSRLEADIARFLDEEGENWVYEPRAFADRSGTYLPDFELLDKPHPTYLEAKPLYRRDAEDAMARMEIIWSSIPDAVLMVMFANHEYAVVTIGRRWELRRFTDLRAA